MLVTFWVKGYNKFYLLQSKAEVRTISFLKFTALADYII